MKTYINKLFIGIVCLILFSGCSDFIDRYPISNPSDETFFSNDSEIKLAINGCYNGLWYFTDYNFPYQLALDHCTDIGWYRMAGASLQQIGNGSHDASVGFAMAFWRDSYITIGRCNLLLTNMVRSKGNITPDVYTRIESEARFIRAYYYSYLAELYGDVPLVTKVLSLSEANVSRTSKSEVIDFVLSELESVATILPDQITEADKGRVSRWSAYGIISRVALYNGKWKQSIDAAQKVMASSRHDLHPDFAELFTYSGQSSKEILFAIQYNKSVRTWQSLTAFGSRMVSGNAIYIPVQSLVDSYECIDGLAIDKSPLFNPKKPYENRDPRLGQTVALPGSEYMGYQFETHRDSVKCWNYNVMPAERIDNTEATHAYASFSGYNWRKWTDPKDKAEPGKSDMNFILQRYAEVLLNYAEAKIESGSIDQSVVDAINKVRARAYKKEYTAPAYPNPDGYPKITTTDKNKLIAAIHRERKYEFANEGLRLFDIRRWKIAEKVMPGPLYGRVKDEGTPGVLLNAPVIDENASPDYSNVTNKNQMFVIEQRNFQVNRDYLWPIPKADMDINPNLAPNNLNY